MLETYPDILTVPEVAKILRVGKNKVYELLEAGLLPGFRIGWVWKISKDSLMNYIAGNAHL